MSLWMAQGSPFNIRAKSFFRREKVEASGVLSLRRLYELVFRKMERMMRAVSVRR